MDRLPDCGKKNISHTRMNLAKVLLVTACERGAARAIAADFAPWVSSSKIWSHRVRGKNGAGKTRPKERNLSPTRAAC